LTTIYNSSQNLGLFIIFGTNWDILISDNNSSNYVSNKTRKSFNYKNAEDICGIVEKKEGNSDYFVMKNIEVYTLE
jgi:hypothetical protein